MTINFVLLLVGGYLLGSVPAAYLAAKWSRGIDIRQHGSGNVGAANVLATASKWVSLTVIIFDLGKGILPVYIAHLLGLPLYQQVIIGLATIIGHNWPVFLRFSGGRGLLTTVGVVSILEQSAREGSFSAPWLALIVVAFAFAWAPFKQLSLGSLCALILLPILSWFLSEPLGMERALALTLGFLAMLLIAIIRRLTAPRSSLTASMSTRQLLLNRLLFDRDIRDREAWLRRQPLKGRKTRGGLRRRK
jgi:glycerol-3-phosphate acyltransferase PlsY